MIAIILVAVLLIALGVFVAVMFVRQWWSRRVRVSLTVAAVLVGLALVISLFALVARGGTCTWGSVDSQGNVESGVCTRAVMSLT